MRYIGNDGMVFGTKEEIRRNYPDSGWTDNQQGYIGDAIILNDGKNTHCISIFIGCGRAVIISHDGRYIDNDSSNNQQIIKERLQEQLAWIPIALYNKADKYRATI